MPDGALPRDHWVSRGFQQNFADDEKRVAILDVQMGQIVDRGRPIKSNFVERGFTTFLEAGVPNVVLERAFASVEMSVLNEIRRVGSSRRGPEQKAAVANLFAVHLVRSPGFKNLHGHISDNFRRSDVPALAGEASLPLRFEAQYGRPPDDGELLEFTLQAFDDLNGDPFHLVTSMIRQHDKIAEMLNGFHMQIVELSPGLPGFVIGDTPIVHANTSADTYGFRDRLAVGDANLVIGPLTRRTAVCFTVRPLEPVVLTTRKMVDTTNAVFIRAAQAEVACHPDDAVAVRQVHSRLDRLPPSILHSG